MTSAHERYESRREFFRGLGRYGVLGALGAAAGWLMGGRKVSQGEVTCNRKGHCLQCPLLDDCCHPVAKSARVVRESERRG